MIIDFHVHCFPDELAARAVPVLAEKAAIPPRLDGTVSDLKNSMKEAGVDYSVILSIATKPSQASQITKWSKSVEGDGIIAFGSIHPDSDKWRQELKEIKEAGLRGVKFHPDYQNFFVDEERIFPIYEAIFNEGLILVFHAGVDIGLPPPCHCTPERLAKVIDAFPGGKVVAAHMGGFSRWDEVENYLLGREIYLDTSYSMGFMDDVQMRRMIDKHGYKKILFATDSPWSSQIEEVEKIKKLKLDSEVEKAILGENARRLLGIEEIS